jgi:hypothetical protein
MTRPGLVTYQSKPRCQPAFGKELAKLDCWGSMLGLGTPGCGLGQEVHRGFRVPEAWSQQWRCLFKLFVGSVRWLVAWFGLGRLGWPCSGTIRESGVRLCDVRSPSSITTSSAELRAASCLGIPSLLIQRPIARFHSIFGCMLTSIAAMPLAATGEQKAISANSVDHCLASLVASDGKAGVFGCAVPSSGLRVSSHGTALWTAEG